jgi:hypothetical protein
MSARRSAGAFAAGVTRALRGQGLVVLPSGTPFSREGVRVRASSTDRAAVSIDLDQPGRATRLANEVAELLAEAGYATERSTHTDTIIYATRKAAQS